MSAAVSSAALARFTPILVQVRAADPSWESAAARALRPFGFYMWQSLSLSKLRGMRVRPEGRIDREWAESLLSSRAPGARRPAPDGSAVYQRMRSPGSRKSSSSYCEACGPLPQHRKYKGKGLGNP